MRKLDEKGDLLLPLVAVIVLLLGSLGFAVWAFMGRQDYKNNTDEKISEAVAVAEQALTIKKDAEYAEAAKSPYVTYQGPGAFGTLTIPHPRTWSVYADQQGRSSQPVDGFMHPGFVSADENTNYALRFQVIEQTYDAVLKTFDGAVKQGKVAVAGYSLPLVQSVLGSRLEGEVVSKKQGVMVLLPLRDKTIKFWTEGSEYGADFEEILKQFSFIP